MKIGVIILARANFGRWPDKVLYKLQGGTLLEHVIRKSKHLDVDEVIISTTESQEDQIIRDIAWECGANISRGDPDDRTARHCQTIRDYNLDYFIILSPGTPFFDVEYSNRLIKVARENPGKDMYHIGGITQGLVIRIYNAEIPLNNKNPDQEVFTDSVKTSYRNYNWHDPELKNRYLFNGNIAYHIQGDNHRRICEFLGHFPENYEEVVEALMGIE